jgi:uncharacterized RDD family membrane protein YckC
MQSEAMQAGVSGNGELRYAGIFRRVGAGLIDMVIILLFALGIHWLSPHSRLIDGIWGVIIYFAGLVYSVYLVKRFGGTPGKRLLNLRICRTDGSAIGYREAILRESVQTVLGGVSMIGMLMAFLSVSDADYLSYEVMQRPEFLLEHVPVWYGFMDNCSVAWTYSEFIVMLTNKRRRSLHDLIAGTVVIHEITQDQQSGDAASSGTT